MNTKDFLQQVPQVKLTFSDPEYKSRARIKCSTDVLSVIAPFYEDCLQHHEEIYAVLISRANTVLGVVQLGVGTIASVMVNEKALYQSLILSNAAACILTHNHPSGNITPSLEDDKLTERQKTALELLGFRLLDHVIISVDEHYSYADNGRIV